MHFIKDIGSEQGWSKFDTLATWCASYAHGIRFYRPGVDGTVVQQAGDGRVLKAPAEYRGRKRIILHDWYDHYMQYVTGCDYVYVLGDFEHPALPGIVRTYASFPVPQMHKLPFIGYDAVIGGEIGLADVDYVLDSLPDECRNVALVCSCGGELGVKRMLDAELVPELTANGVNVGYRNSHTGLPLLISMYRSARCIIHCGSGNLGMLHSIAAMHYNENPAADVITKRGKIAHKVASLEVFARNFC